MVGAIQTEDAVSHLLHGRVLATKHRADQHFARVRASVN